MRIRSGHSYRVAVGHLPDVMSRLQEINYPVAPISDHMSTFAFTKWTALAKAANLRPLYGVSIDCVPELGARKPVADRWTFFAINDLAPLHELIARATANPGREPSLLYSQALAQPGVIAIAGERLQIDRLPQDRPQPFAALSPSTPKGLVRRVEAAGLLLLATGDNLYPRPADKEFYRTALGRRSTTQTYPLHILSDDEWLAATSWAATPKQQQEALDNRQRAMGLCRTTMKRARLLVPEKPQSLRAMCESGAETKGIDLTNPVYAERVNRELTLIADKGFEDYFYIIADLVQWARQRMMVGPARGSSCGSLVCYLLDITTVDPIPYGLIFERFLSPDRIDAPDIDIDLDDTQRHLLFDYAEQRYGKDHVARLGSVGTFQEKSATKQIGAALKWSNKPKLAEFTARLQDHPSHATQHAAGLLITDQPIINYVAVDSRTNGAWCDKQDAEALGLLKIDTLGLIQLSIFRRTLELIKEPNLRFLETISLDDPAAFAVLNERHFSGIFQFTGNALRTYSQRVTFTTLEDIVAMTALVRPGPLDSGGADLWIRRKSGAPVLDLPSALAAMTADTYGIIIYQEQVIRILREIGQLSWEDTSELRKAMAKSKGNEFFADYRQKFVDGAKATGLSDSDAFSIWDQLLTFGSYGFNRSHAVAYAIVSYWCCWLKAHHPLPFAAATLDALNDPADQLAYLRELDAEGVSYIPVDPLLSTDRWSVAERNGRPALIGPLTAIKGLGPAKYRRIMDARAEGADIGPVLTKQLAAAQTDIDSLYPIADAIKRLHPNGLEAINIVSRPTPVAEVQPGLRGDVLILGVVRRIAPKDENDAASVERRGYAVKGPSQALNIFIADDSGEVFCKVAARDMARLAAPFLNGSAKLNKTLVAIKGRVPPAFRMITVQNVRVLGEMT